MDFRTDDAQLLGLWTATVFSGRSANSKSQWTTQNLDQGPNTLDRVHGWAGTAGPDQTSSGSPRAGLGRVVAFDA